MTALKSDCRKFSANIFNKTKCQNCFRTKEAHSAEALECNRASRKVSKCGYLFVAPDWDFSVSINRTKRWQRRWFVLYDDGELTYSVDEHPDTVPQAVIDMNKVVEVSDAEDLTGNQYAIAITAPEKVHFVKGTSREESKWWFDVLNRLPRNNVRGKHKRNATFPGGMVNTAPVAMISDQIVCPNEQVRCTDVVQRPRFLSTSEPSRSSIGLKDWNWLQVNGNEEDVFPTKDCEHDVLNSVSKTSPDEDEAKHDETDTAETTSENINNVLNNLIMSAVQLNNSHSLSSQTKKDAKDIEIVVIGKEEELKEKKGTDGQQENAKKSRSRRYLKRENRGLRMQRSRSDGIARMIPNHRELFQDDSDIMSKSTKDSSVVLLLDTPKDTSTPVAAKAPCYERLTECSSVQATKSVLESRRDTPLKKRSTLKKSESLMNIASELSQEMRNRISELKRNYSYKGSPSMYKNKSDASSQSAVKTSSNPFIRPVRDTDPKSSTVQCSTNRGVNASPSRANSDVWDIAVDVCTEGVLMKKGWLMRQTLTKDWSRHWFVLKNASLTYYRDPSAEDCGILDGVLDLNQVTNIGELDSDKTFAFCLVMWDNKKHVLCAVSPEVRTSWIRAVQSASNLWDSESRKDFTLGEIILPEHTFHSSNAKGNSKSVNDLSSLSSPAESPELEKTDLSSSDDQSEYFSIIDEEETGDRAASPRTLPPSPPVNRNAMSLVKERARTRSNTYFAPLRQHSFPGAIDSSELHSTENGVTTNSLTTYCRDSHVNSNKTYQDICMKLMESHLQLSRKPESPVNEEPSVHLRMHEVNENMPQSIITLQNRCKDLEKQLGLKTTEINEKALDIEAFRKLKIAYQNLVEKQKTLKKISNQSEKSLSVEGNLDDNYRLKYELLRAKYIQDRMEWECKLKKEKLLPVREDNFDNYIKILQKTKEVLVELKCRLPGEYAQSVASQEIAQLCEDIDKLPLPSERKQKRDLEVKKLRKTVTELRVLYNNKQQKLVEEQNKLSDLNMAVQKKDKEIQELQWELEFLKNTDLQSKSLQGKPLHDVSGKDIQDCVLQMCVNCIALNEKLTSAKEQIKKLKKDIKDSHTSFDDLEIHCFKLKHDVKSKEENHQSQMALMTARVDDLTSKFTLSEKNLRQLKQKLSKVESRQERRRSSLKNKESLSLSKECEAKLFELEQKITNIEDELRDDRHSSAQEEVLQHSPDPQSEASEIAESERHLHKRLSQDSASSSENTSTLLRLHNLGMRVKVASEAAEKHIQETAEIGVMDRPTICLQLRNDEELSVQEECGEDWSTISYATSLTDLQAIDCLDSEFPSTWAECFECLEQKLESLLSWAKSAIQFVQKQDLSFPEKLSNASIGNSDAVTLSNFVIDVLDNLPGIKEGPSLLGASFETVKVCYKSLLVNETARVLQNIVFCESSTVLQKLAVCSYVFQLICSHLQLLRETDIGKSIDLVKKLIFLSVTPYESLLNEALEDFEQVSQQPSDRLLVIEKYCTQLRELLGEAKSQQFSSLHYILADVPVQDADATKRKTINKDFQDVEPFLSNIGAMLSQFYKTFEHELCEPHHQKVPLLQCEYEAYSNWCSNARKILKLEIESIVSDLKKISPQVQEQNLFSFSFSNSLYRKIVFASVDLARIALLRILAQSVLDLIADENPLHIECNSKEWTNKLHEHLYSKAVSLSKGETFSCDCTETSENLLLNHILEAGAREIKMAEQLEAVHHMHQKEIESVHGELESAIQENNKLRSQCSMCEEMKLKLQELQDSLQHLSKEQICCDNCQTLTMQLHSLREQYDGEVLSLRKQHKDKTDELHKHLQLVLEQKDEIHLHEVQKLENELQATRKRMNHLEVEYSEQIQSLRELYEQKTSMKQDPINEESIRRRYQTEIEQLKGLCEKGLTAMENSYRRITMELERRHKQELTMLEAEKEKVLQEETQATLTALEVMRKAHAEDLQREITQFKEEFLRKMQADYQSETFHQKHESEVEEIKREILSISEKYSVKCLESAAFEERVEVLGHQLQEANHQLFDLMARNKQLKVHLAIDIAQKKDAVEKMNDDDDDDDDAVENQRLLVQLKQSELAEKQEENAQLKQELHLAQMHVSMLDVQCEQLSQSLKAERRLREEEVSSLRSRLEAIIASSPIESTKSAERIYSRGSKFPSPRSFLYRSPSLNLPSHRLENNTPPSWRVLTFARTKELLRSPSCPGLEKTTHM